MLLVIIKYIDSIDVVDNDDDDDDDNDVSMVTVAVDCVCARACVCPDRRYAGV